MEFPELNRRSFLRTSAVVAAIGAGLSADSASAAAVSRAEVKEWQSRIGSQFKAGSSELVLRSVNVADHSGDGARPKNIRTHSIALLFALKSGQMDANHNRLTHDGQQLHVTQVIPPRGSSGEFFEVILN